MTRSSFSCEAAGMTDLEHDTSKTVRTFSDTVVLRRMGSVAAIDVSMLTDGLETMHGFCQLNT